MLIEQCRERWYIGRGTSPKRYRRRSNKDQPVDEIREHECDRGSSQESPRLSFFLQITLFLQGRKFLVRSLCIRQLLPWKNSKEADLGNGEIGSGGTASLVPAQSKSMIRRFIVDEFLVVVEQCSHQGQELWFYQSCETTSQVLCSLVRSYRTGESQDISTRLCNRKRDLTYLWDRIGRHQPVDIRLDPFVQPNHCLKLTSMKDISNSRLHMTFDTGVFIRCNLVHVRDELGTQVVVNVQFARRRRRQVSCKWVSLAQKTKGTTHCCK